MVRTSPTASPFSLVTTFNAWASCRPVGVTSTRDQKNHAPSNFPFIDYCRLTVAKVSSFLSGMMEYETPKVVKVRDVNCDVHRVPLCTHHCHYKNRITRPNFPLPPFLIIFFTNPAILASFFDDSLLRIGFLLPLWFGGLVHSVGTRINSQP